jgi:osmotically-inducible protein OsmY
MRAVWHVIARFLGVVSLVLLLASCAGVGSVWTGAMLVYDRHNLYKKIDDYHLGADAHRVLFQDKHLQCDGCVIDVAVFHRDVLLTGHVPSRALRAEANARLDTLPSIRTKYNQLAIRTTADHTMHDSWITAKIRSQMMADAEINPRQFKVVTADGIVYLMGDVLPGEADRVIQIARQTEDVLRVVTLFNYYRLSSK